MRIAEGVLLCLAAAPAFALDADPVDRLSRLSLQELGKLEVTSVSKAAEPLQSAAAAIFVITRDDLRHSGARSIPEALRLAPNLQVIRLTASSYQVSARGFGGNQEAQNFSNKLLMLIDGRSVYSPLFAGIYFDAQDVLLDDVERIEVISGPGATLWGANAMNGVINIITRGTAETQGVLANVMAGNRTQAAEARWGSRQGDALSYRAYVKGFKEDSLDQASGASAGDSWKKGQVGFRLDWGRGADLVTASADAYRAMEDVPESSADTEVKGGNVLARWRHEGERTRTQVQAYVDRTERETTLDSSGFTLTTYDFELQQGIDLERHRLVWGAGKRFSNYDISSTGALLFAPAHRTLRLGNLFAQDTIDLGAGLSLVAGIKLEDNPYSGWSTLPDLRLSWHVTDESLLWIAGSRAIRSPTPFDTDVIEEVGGSPFLTGNPSFEPEKVSAWEVGLRARPHAAVSLTLTGFFNEYDDLRTIELDPVTGFLPLQWGNLMKGDTYGVEAWADLQLTSWWRLSPGVRTLHKRLRFEEGASRLLGVAQAGNDPTNQASLRSSFEMGARGSLDFHLRHVDSLPDPDTPGYYELNARLAWRWTEALEVAVTGSDLLHRRHVEYAAPAGEAIGRSVFAEMRWAR
jgi:iron complex outermembrane receptor protein